MEDLDLLVVEDRPEEVRDVIVSAWQEQEWRTAQEERAHTETRRVL